MTSRITAHGQALLERSLEAVVPEAQSGQIALLFPGNAVNQSNPKYGDSGMAQCGHPGDSIPWWGWSGHLDGQWAGGCVPPDAPDDPVTDDRHSFSHPMAQTFGRGGATYLPGRNRCRVEGGSLEPMGLFLCTSTPCKACVWSILSACRPS
jgi:hypothetical protein